MVEIYTWKKHLQCECIGNEIESAHGDEGKYFAVVIVFTNPVNEKCLEAINAV